MIKETSGRLASNAVDIRTRCTQNTNSAVYCCTACWVVCLLCIYIYIYIYIYIHTYTYKRYVYTHTYIISASNRNEYQEYSLGGKCGRCVGLTTLPPSCAVCLEIREDHPPETLRVCTGL